MSKMDFVSEPILNKAELLGVIYLLSTFILAMLKLCDIIAAVWVKVPSHFTLIIQ